MATSTPLDRREKLALAGVVLAAVACVLLPVIPQSQAYHGFADRRSLFGIPNAADVLSNLAFVAVGLFGMRRLILDAIPLTTVVKASLGALFAGLILTGIGSGWYHWNPNDQTLVGDRLPMTIAFAGVTGALFAERISLRSGAAMLALMLVVGPVSVFLWKSTGNLTPYIVVQSGVMAAVLLILLLTPRGQDPFPWWALLLWYALAKLFELADATIWRVTGELFAGHALKHLAAAMGGLAIANALRSPRT